MLPLDEREKHTVVEVIGVVPPSAPLPFLARPVDHARPRGKEFAEQVSSTETKGELRASIRKLRRSDDAMFEQICPKATWCPRDVLESLLELAIEIAREGREGRRIGTLFTLGFADAVLRYSRPLILDPVAMHPPELRRITDPDLRGTLKELAQLDGAFIVDEKGIVVAACRYLDTSSKEVELTFGLGSRHLAAASISKETNAIAIAVSESAVVRIYYQGRLQAEVLPELWLLSRHSLHLRGRIHQDSLQDVAIFTTEESSSKAERPT